MADTEKDLDRRSIRRAFDASAPRYDEAAVLQRHVADELDARLADIGIEPRRVLELGSGTGYLTRMLVERFHAARVFAMDLSPAMTRRTGEVIPGQTICADAENVPFAEAQFDLAVSNMLLQWCDYRAVFESIRKLLKPGGLWLFSSVGPDTLIELRESWRAVDSRVRVHAFEDMHHLGDALLASGFKDPVMDIDRINLTYPDAAQLVRDLRTLGVVNASSARSRGLMSRRKYDAFLREYEKYRQPDGDLPSTWEIIYGHAWAPSPGSVRVNFEAAGGVST